MLGIPKNWKFWVLVIVPLVFLPILFIDDESGSTKFKCSYVILLMGVFWMLEAMPLAITALLPVALFPLLGILSTAQVVPNYMKEAGMMFIGGITLALAIQYSNLHKRIALRTMILIGSSPWRILLGIMVTTMFLSCWMANTSVAAMMIPIVIGLIDSLDESESEEHKNKLKVLYMLAVGYSANIGGTAVIIGSNPNIIYKGLIAVENVGQSGKYRELNFLTWSAFNLPIAIINLIIVWIYLGCLYLGGFSCFKRGTAKGKGEELQNALNAISLSSNISGKDFPTDLLAVTTAEKMKQELQNKYKELGKMTFHEKAVLTLFALTVLLWFSRDPQIFIGWMNLFTNNIMIGDSTVAICIVILLFVIPKDSKYFFGDFSGSPETLLSWDFVHKNYPWNVILLYGGGFAISDGADKSGLSLWFGEQLNGLDGLSNPVILIIILVVVSCFTEVMSNAAAISLLTPILIALSKRLQLHPLYLTLPAAIACQYAFILPTSNPPNAIVFTAGNMKIMDMAKPGLFLNFACLIILYLMNISWGQYVIFNYNGYKYAEYNCTVNCF